jgi:hypothetical protein
MRFLKAVGGERSHNVLDALVERLERNSGTIDTQRRFLRAIPECPAERMNLNHRLLFNKERLGPRSANQSTSLMEVSRHGLRRLLFAPPLHPLLG